MTNAWTIRGSALALTVAVICGSTESPAADWPQFGRDGTRNAVSPERRPPVDWDVGKWTDTNPRQHIEGSSRNIKWSAPLGWSTYGDPVVTGGLVWVGTNNNPGNAQDKLDASVLASPVFADNRIFIATGISPEFGGQPGRLVCLDPTLQGDISSELAVDSTGKIIPHRRIQAVDPAQGEKAIPNPGSGLVWEFTHVGEGNSKEFTNVMHSMMSNVAVHNGLVIAPDQDGLVHCLDAKTGQRYWAFDALASVYGSPLIVDDKVYVADTDGEVMVFGLSTS